MYFKMVFFETYILILLNSLKHLLLIREENIWLHSKKVSDFLFLQKTLSIYRYQFFIYINYKIQFLFFFDSIQFDCCI